MTSPTFLTSSPIMSPWLLLLQVHSCLSQASTCTGGSFRLEYTSPRSPHGSFLDSSRSLFKSHLLPEAFPDHTFENCKPNLYLRIPFPGLLVDFYKVCHHLTYYRLYCVQPSTPNYNVNLIRKAASVLISAGSLVPTIKQSQ